jgi:5-oxoprolinase (ATP-hydrolysing) subunit B
MRDDRSGTFRARRRGPGGVAMKVRRFGDQALLVEVDGIDTVLGLYTALTDSLPEGVTELVPAARTLLVRFDPRRIDPGALAALLADTDPFPAAPFSANAPFPAMASIPAHAGKGDHVTIPVVYDGADLRDIGRRTGLGVDGVIATHTATDYVVAFGGFTPGFGYLTGLDPRLHVPRHDAPRTHVPSGAVAIAGEFAGIYPRSSPGGWQLLGRTELLLWDPDRRPPALLTPGTRVRFEAVAG